jgi:hypothetical protein
VPLSRIELETFCLQDKRSTTELQRRLLKAGIEPATFPLLRERSTIELFEHFALSEFRSHDFGLACIEIIYKDRALPTELLERKIWSH